MGPTDYADYIGYLLGSFAVGLCAGYILAAFKQAAKSSSR